MKFPIIATMLLVLTVPILATEPASAARAATAAQWRDIRAFEHAYFFCYQANPDEHPAEEIKKGCDSYERLLKKLKAQGLCAYGHIAIGVSSNDKKHCYTLHDPSIPSRFHQH